MNKKLFGFMVCMLLGSLSIGAKTYSISKIAIGKGAFDIYVAGGDLRVSVDDNNKIFTVSTSIKDIKGDEYDDYLPLEKIMSGKSISFPDREGEPVIVKIAGQPGFSDKGGKIKISMKKEEGWVSEILNIATSTGSKDPNKYYLWKGNTKVKEIGINGSTEAVSWYELN